MTILVPPRADPNITCAVEGFSLSNTISGTKQVMTVTIATPSEAAGTARSGGGESWRTGCRW